MNKLVLALVTSSAVALAAAPALAQTAPNSPASVDWTGWKAGAQFAQGWGDEHDNFSEVTGYPGDFQSADKYHISGRLAGVNAGYDMQMGPWVFGVTADFGLTDTGGKTSATFSTGEGTGFSALSLRNSWQSTVRVRGGYAFDRALFYVAGGVATGDARVSYRVFDPENIGNTPVHGNEAKTLVGYTVGAGVQYAIAAHWSIGAEGRYVDLGNTNYSIPASLGNGQTSFKAGFNESQAVAFVQFRF